MASARRNEDINEIDDLDVDLDFEEFIGLFLEDHSNTNRYLQSHQDLFFNSDPSAGQDLESSCNENGDYVSGSSAASDVSQVPDTAPPVNTKHSVTVEIPDQMAMVGKVSSTEGSCEDSTLISEEQRKSESVKERNRLSARKSREEKKKYYKKLKDKHESLRKENEKLREDVKNLRWKTEVLESNIPVQACDEDASVVTGEIDYLSSGITPRQHNGNYIATLDTGGNTSPCNAVYQRNDNNIATLETGGNTSSQNVDQGDNLDDDTDLGAFLNELIENFKAAPSQAQKHESLRKKNEKLREDVKNLRLKTEVLESNIPVQACDEDASVVTGEIDYLSSGITPRQHNGNYIATLDTGGNTSPCNAVYQRNDNNIATLETGGNTSSQNVDQGDNLDDDTDLGAFLNELIENFKAAPSQAQVSVSQPSCVSQPYQASHDLIATSVSRHANMTPGFPLFDTKFSSMVRNFCIEENVSLVHNVSNSPRPSKGDVSVWNVGGLHDYRDSEDTDELTKYFIEGPIPKRCKYE